MTAMDPDELATRSLAHRARGGGARVVVIGEGGVVTHELPPSGAVVLGRSSQADVRIDDPSLSRRHACLHVAAEDGAVTVEDLGSQNGTRVAGRAVAPGTRVALGDGDAVELGSALVVVQLGPRAAAAAPDAAPEIAGAATSDAALIDRIARSSVNVLILGETGVGKERMAERLHARSRRAAGPLIKINCPALAESLIESELFGHEKGAFTGAVAARAGVIEAADGGTLFLDEVGELSPAMQAKLLRVLEQREVLRVGAARPITVDVRFVAATNRDLAAMAQAGAFRQDLYYRLDGITVRVPALRERPGELALIARELLVEACKREGVAPVPSLSAEALAALRAHPWPGNVRELRNVLDRALLRWTGGPIMPAHLELAAAPVAAAGAPAGGGPGVDAGELRDDVDAFEKQRILAVLERCGGNQTRAAEELGISRRTLVSRLQAWGMTKPRR